ncbi:hypothetical protein COV16_06605 [Candidatus Woesearchaeota archaeon CG10_big_fil_rev_8_21_14_0_10_34_8]|nr:MAG: hypothetical protein COV16_06605 [Candidatus Woesearchaeota archaeon CG10_big_fil_rev_8_21_14_0_10_34_8]
MIDQASITQSYSSYGDHETPKDKKKGLFGQFGHNDPAPVMGADITGQMRDFSRRLRILEERYSNQRKNVQVMQHNMLSEHKKLQEQMRSMQKDFDSLKKQIYEIQQQFDLIGSELRETAKREDVVVLEKYINLWEPINFVTRKEVEKLINFILDSKKK